VASLAVGLAACSSCHDENATQVSAPVLQIAEPSDDVVTEPTARPVAPPIPAPEPVEDLPADEVAALADATNRLGLALYATLRERPGNFAISPASVELAMAMTAIGARAETAAEMERVLGLDSARPHDAAASLLRRWNDPEAPGDLELRVINRLFGEQTFRFEQDFLYRARTSYAAPLESVDFRTDADGARQRVNGWVSEQTAERIRELLPPGSVDATTPLVLVNAVYLLAKWAQPFDPTATRDAPFHTAADATVQAPFMNRTGPMRYAEDDAVHVVELPYRGGRLAMLVVVPKTRDGLRAVESTLDVGVLRRWTDGLRDRPVALALPKLTIDPPAPMELADALADLGMPRAFDRARADFSGMAAPLTDEDRLFIARVFHQAFVRFDEEGTEAAAATAVVMGPAGAPPPPDPPVAVRADRPFLFLIRDIDNGAALFFGRCVAPTS
jgi:serpin B